MNRVLRIQNCCFGRYMIGVPGVKDEETLDLNSYQKDLMENDYDLWFTVHRSSMWIKRSTRCHF